MMLIIRQVAAANRLRRALETAIVKDNVRTRSRGSASTTEFARAVAAGSSHPCARWRQQPPGSRRETCGAMHEDVSRKASRIGVSVPS